MHDKADIVRDWLPRYTGRGLGDFGEHILLTNFSHYVSLFARRFGVEIVGDGFPIQSATAENLPILYFGMGSAMAATVMDLLAAVSPQAVLFLVGFANHIPKGALLLVSDNPMTPEGVKTARSDREVNRRFVEAHLDVGIDALIELRDSGESVKHMRYE